MIENSYYIMPSVCKRHAEIMLFFFQRNDNELPVRLARTTYTNFGCLAWKCVGLRFHFTLNWLDIFMQFSFLEILYNVDFLARHTHLA